MCGDCAAQGSTEGRLSGRVECLMKYMKGCGLVLGELREALGAGGRGARGAGPGGPRWGRGERKNKKRSGAENAAGGRNDTSPAQSWGQGCAHVPTEPHGPDTTSRCRLDMCGVVSAPFTGPPPCRTTNLQAPTPMSIARSI